MRHLAGGRALVDRAELARQTGLAEVTIRVRLRPPVEYDKDTHRAMYDHDAASAVLARVMPRRRRAA